MTEINEESDEYGGKGEAQTGASTGRGKALTILGYIFVGLAALLAIYGTIFVVAWDQGQVQKAREEESALATELENQMSMAIQERVDGKYNLAARRLEWILERDADYPGATALLSEIHGILNKPPTPTAIPVITSTPSSSETPSAELEARDELATLQRLISSQEWKKAITEILAFQSKYPGYQRQQTDTLLYNAYLNLGQNLVMGDQVELGLFYFEQAEKLGDLPIEAEDQRTWADLYLSGISYYGIDWGTAAFYFRGLCSAAPFYQDACSKLYEILVAYGDQHAANQDFCPAEALYFEANQLNNEADLQEKIEEARTRCIEATPTPTLTPTLPISATATLEGGIPEPQNAGQ